MMEELGNKTLQHSESEERYRKFIEMARSPVVTFLEDGKIVISNEPAEKLLNMSKRDLLGESIYHFLEDGDSIRQGIMQYLREGSGEAKRTSVSSIRDRQGKLVKVEIVLSASMTDHKPLFTAIIRKLGE
jgi:PAS domain S-box-containing protein